VTYVCTATITLTNSIRAPQWHVSPSPDNISVEIQSSFHYSNCIGGPYRSSYRHSARYRPIHYHSTARIQTQFLTFFSAISWSIIFVRFSSKVENFFFSSMPLIFAISFVFRPKRICLVHVILFASYEAKKNVRSYRRRQRWRRNRRWSVEEAAWCWPAAESSSCTETEMQWSQRQLECRDASTNHAPLLTLLYLLESSTWRWRFGFSRDPISRVVLITSRLPC